MTWPTDPRRLAAHRAAVRESGLGERHLWRSCYYCAVIVGRYEKGATVALARELHRSVDTVEDRAKAAVTFFQLYKTFRASPEILRRLKELRRSLGYTFFTQAGDRMRQDVSPLDVFADLDTAEREGSRTRVLDRHTNRKQAVEFPTFLISSTYVTEMAREFPNARVVILTEDAGEKVKVMV